MPILASTLAYTGQQLLANMPPGWWRDISALKASLYLTPQLAPPHNNLKGHQNSGDNTNVGQGVKNPPGSAATGHWALHPPQPEERWGHGSLPGRHRSDGYKEVRLWAFDTFWLYVTSPCVAVSSVAAALALAMD